MGSASQIGPNSPDDRVRVARPALRRGHPPRVARVAHVADLDHRDGDVGHVQGAEVAADVETGAAADVVRPRRCRRAVSDVRSDLRQPQRRGRRCRSSTACVASARSRGSRGRRTGRRRRAARPSGGLRRACRTGRGRRRTGPTRLTLLVVRVIRTRAPSASSRRFTARERRKFTVASGTPLLVAAPVVLQGFLKPPAGTSRLISRVCRLLPSW